MAELLARIERHQRSTRRWLAFIGMLHVVVLALFAGLLWGQYRVFVPGS
jgi:hypothetical protein